MQKLQKNPFLYNYQLGRQPAFTKVIGALLYLITILLTTLFATTALFPTTIVQAQNPPLVTQEIHYSMPEAGEVFFVWGVNGWQIIPEDTRPAETKISDNTMHTPMVLKNGTFVVKIQVPMGATIDYGFLITKRIDGTPTREWDADNTKDFHTLATEDGLIEVSSVMSLTPLVEATDEEFPSTGLSFNVPWLAIILTGLIFIVAIVAWQTHHVHSETFLLILVLLLAANLRLNHITQPFTDAFSWRQASTAMIADNYYQTNWNIFYPEASWGGSGPSYQGREFQTVTYLAAMLYTIFEQQAWVGRLVSVTFGVWGIFALYQLVCRVWDKKRALVSTAVMAILPGSIFIERSFLPDPAMVALMTTSFWILVVFLQTGSWRYLLFAGILAAWGSATKLPGLIVGLPMLYVTLVVLKRKQLLTFKRMALISTVATFFLMPVIIYYLWARHLSLTYPPYHFAGSGNWLWDAGLATWWEQKFFVYKLVDHFYSWIWTLPVLVLVLFGLAFPIFERWRTLNEQTDKTDTDAGQAVWTFHWWFAAFFIYYLLGAQELNDNPWNFHIINPAAAAIAGYALTSIISLLKIKTFWRPASAVATILVLLVIGAFGQESLKWLYKPYAHQSYELGTALNQQSQPGELVVTIANTIGDPIGIYYSQRRGWTFPPSHPDRAWNQLPNDQESIRLFEELREKGAAWFGVVNEHLHEIQASHPALVKHLEKTTDVALKTSDYVIYHIYPPEEVPLVSVDPKYFVTAELRYYLPEAGEVFLVWGIDGWNMVPEHLHPTETKILDNVMYTPMVRTDNNFVTEVQVPMESTIDYGFLITQHQNGAAIHEWDANGEQDYHTPIMQADVIEINSTLDLASIANVDETELVTQEIQYTLAEAGEGFLIWGINGWHLVPEAWRPFGSLLKDDVIYTPLIQADNGLVAKVTVPIGTSVDYVFLITKDKNGVPVEVWADKIDRQIIVDTGGITKVSPLASIREQMIIETIKLQDIPWLFFIFLILICIVLFIFLQSHFKFTNIAREYRLKPDWVKAIILSPFILVFLLSAYIFFELIGSPEATWKFFNSPIFKENGIVELTTFALLFAAGSLGLVLAWQLQKRKADILTYGFYYIFSIGLIVLAMEEVSWGQWFIGFETPATFRETNVQGELNFHNVEGLQGNFQYLLIIFGLGGLAGIWLSRHKYFTKITPSLILSPWFVVIAALAGLDLYTDYYVIHRYFDQLMRQFDEVVEMFVAMTGCLFIWLNTKSLLPSQTTSQLSEKALITSNSTRLTYYLYYLYDLLRELVSRDLKLRYKRSVLGIVWSLINPLALLLVLYFIFDLVLPLDVPNYPSFLFTGLLVWTWFQSALFSATTAIVDSPDLIKRPGFPVAVLPIVTVITHLIHFLLALPILFAFLVISEISLSTALALLPVIMILQFLLTLGISYFLAAIHVSFRDTQYLLGIILLLGFYLSPIFYQSSLIPEAYQWLYHLNPMVSLLEAYRAVLIEGTLPATTPLITILVASIATLWVGYRFFIQASYRFVEEI